MTCQLMTSWANSAGVPITVSWIGGLGRSERFAGDMAQRNVHYEAAFEDYLRARGWPYVAVDEAKKAIFGAASIKSFDFLVYSESGPNLLVDVKGRKFPAPARPAAKGSTKRWENWITQEDASGLTEWQKVFGGDFATVLVFAYWLQGPPQRAPFADVHLYKGKHYAFVVVTLADYLANAKPRSTKWRTVAVASRTFAKLAADIASML